MRDYEYFGSSFQQDGPAVEFVEHAPGDLADSKVAGEHKTMNSRMGAAGKALFGIAGVATLGLGVLFGTNLMNPAVAQAEAEGTATAVAGTAAGATSATATNAASSAATAANSSAASSSLKSAISAAASPKITFAHASSSTPTGKGAKGAKGGLSFGGEREGADD